MDSPQVLLCLDMWNELEAEQNQSFHDLSGLTASCENLESLFPNYSLVRLSTNFRNHYMYGPVLKVNSNQIERHKNQDFSIFKDQEC